ncbi:hypothetical protein E2C01_004773 [Portunus trituberculatus]|uniref:Uncharacterized protein n=1 Tax=Portunus trituberculatus TaxID=210409 RepID=A0A5B7CTX0_PORTR|nr:hypothetical protein [Portunus trituberculatus]
MEKARGRRGAWLQTAMPDSCSSVASLALPVPRHPRHLGLALNLAPPTARDSRPELPRRDQRWKGWRRLGLSEASIVRPSRPESFGDVSESVRGSVVRQRCEWLSVWDAEPGGGSTGGTSHRPDLHKHHLSAATAVPRPPLGAYASTIARGRCLHVNYATCILPADRWSRQVLRRGTDLLSGAKPPESSRLIVV